MPKLPWNWLFPSEEAQIVTVMNKMRPEDESCKVLEALQKELKKSLHSASPDARQGLTKKEQ